jgi:hypothetical protein
MYTATYSLILASITSLNEFSKYQNAPNQLYQHDEVIHLCPRPHVPRRRGLLNDYPRL